MRFIVPLCILFSILVLSPSMTRAQALACDTSLATERWSVPVRLPFWVYTWDYGSAYPSFDPDGRTIWFIGKPGVVCSTTLSDTGWTQAKIYSPLQGVGLIRGTCMAADHRTSIFARAVVGGKS